MHIMLDLETMGVDRNAAIISIGAVKFDEFGIKDEFYETVDLKSSMDIGGTITASTVLWWLTQSEKARFDISKNKSSDINFVLKKLSNFICESSKVWGNGAGFDNVILREAYHNAGIDCPFPFWNDRCFRTISSLFPSIKISRIGTHHNSLDDAKTQANHLIKLSKIARDLGVDILC